MFGHEPADTICSVDGFFWHFFVQRIFWKGQQNPSPKLQIPKPTHRDTSLHMYIYICVYMVVSLNYCSQNGGNLYRAPYYNGKPNIGPRIIGNLDQYPYMFMHAYMSLNPASGSVRLPRTSPPCCFMATENLPQSESQALKRASTMQRQSWNANLLFYYYCGYYDHWYYHYC